MQIRIKKETPHFLQLGEPEIYHSHLKYGKIVFIQSINQQTWTEIQFIFHQLTNICTCIILNILSSYGSIV